MNIFKLLIRIFLRFWKKASKQLKIAITIIVLVSIVSLVFMGKYAILSYQYHKNIETEYNRLTTESEQAELEQKQAIDTNKKATVKTLKKSENIDKKLKQDEKNIDNSTISDADIDALLSKYGQK